MEKLWNERAQIDPTHQFEILIPPGRQLFTAQSNVATIRRRLEQNPLQYSDATWLVTDPTHQFQTMDYFLTQLAPIQHIAPRNLVSSSADQGEILSPDDARTIWLPLIAANKNCLQCGIEVMERSLSVSQLHRHTLLCRCARLETRC